MPEFTPSYLEIDFLTLVEKFKQELQESDVFKDYDFEGSNIAILLELMAYVGELNTYFINKVAKNCFLETADVYEAANRLSRQIGYEPKGTRSARGTLSVSVTGTSAGDVLRVLPWKQIDSGRDDDNGNSIKFATTSSVQVTATGTSALLSVPIRQGEILELTGYTGEDLIDNELILPQEYSYDDDIDDLFPSLKVEVNGTEWTRLESFYDDVTPQEDDNVYTFVYDRYRRDKIIFNSSRNVPEDSDTIDITVLDSLGTDGSIGADSGETWSIDSSQFIEKTSGATVSYVDNSNITLSLSAATIGAAAPETISELRTNAESALRAQFRNVTANDYNAHLSSRSDVVKATAWGEQDIAPSAGDPEEYNIVHISVIPQSYGSSTIDTSESTFTTDWGLSASIDIPTVYSSSWSSELLEYTKPRKMLSAYEVMEVPDLVYFSFEIGVRKKRSYTFTDIATDVKNKLIYYFRASNQSFNSIVSFNDIIEYILDTSEISSSDDFDNIRGIRNLNIRDINLNKTIYVYNSGLYPRWADAPWTDRDNKLRRIQIGLDQFPVLSADNVRIFEES